MSLAPSWIDRRTVCATPLGQLSQIDLANEVNSPSPEEVTRAQRILEAMAEAEKAGKVAVSLDSRLIDDASIRQAEVLVQRADQIGTPA